MLRSYIHFAIWSAFANGHAGTPLKWGDAKKMGDMFPHGGLGFSSDIYPNLGEELLPLNTLVQGEDVDLNKLRRNLISREWANPEGNLTPSELEPQVDMLVLDEQQQNFSSVRAFGLSTKKPGTPVGEEEYIVWLFDDDFDKDWDSDGWDECDWGKSNNRSYDEANETSKAAHKLILYDVPSQHYLILRYNTWEGNFIGYADDIDRDEDNNLVVPVGTFATDSSHPDPQDDNPPQDDDLNEFESTWDGADVLLIILKDPYQP